jgi:hypothetical protein
VSEPANDRSLSPRTADAIRAEYRAALADIERAAKALDAARERAKRLIAELLQSAYD